MSDKKMKVIAVHEYLLFKEAVNPFLKLKTDSGIILMPGLADSKETGNIEELDQLVGFGLVEAVGDQCKYVRVGDGIFYDRRSIRAVPLKETLWQYQERNVIAVVPQEDGILQEAYAEYYKELAELEAEQSTRNVERKAEDDARLGQIVKDVNDGKIKGPLSPLIKFKDGR
jgi:hypothetical protein